MNKNPSSEEKLLNLIRKKKENSPKASRSAEKSDALIDWGAMASLFWKWGAGFFLLGTICLLAFLLAKYQMLNRPDRAVSDVAIQPPARSSETNVWQENMPTSSQNYHEIIQARDIFSSPVEPKKEAGPSSSSSQKSALSERYKLVGIMLDNNPTAIIEDLQSHQTSILSKGQKINDVTIEDIKADRILLKEDDQIIELVR